MAVRLASQMTIKSATVAGGCVPGSCYQGLRVYASVSHSPISADAARAALYTDLRYLLHRAQGNCRMGLPRMAQDQITSAAELLGVLADLDEAQ